GGGRVTASPLTAPLLISGWAGASTPEESCTVLLSSAWIASPPPANTTVAILARPSRDLRTSASSWGVVPTGGVETLNRVGSFFATAMKSFMVPTPSSGFTANTLGEVASSAIGAKSLKGSYGSVS